MGIKELIPDEADESKPIRERIERLRNPELCPECGIESKEPFGDEDRMDKRCPDDDCDVITYYPSSKQ